MVHEGDIGRGDMGAVISLIVECGGRLGDGSVQGFGGNGTQGSRTYFLKAAATPAPQEPFVLQASGDSLVRKCGEEKRAKAYG